MARKIGRDRSTDSFAYPCLPESGKFAAALYYARQYPDQFRIVAAPDPGVAASPISIGVRKGDQNWLNYLNWALYDLKASGKLQALHIKWFGNDSLQPNWVRQPL